MRISIFFLLLFCVIVIPGAYYNITQSASYGQGSYSKGALLSVSIVGLIYILKYKSISFEKAYNSFFTILILIFVVSLFSMLFSDWFEFNRFFLSYFLLSFSMIGSIFFVIMSKNVDDEDVYNHISTIFYIILLDAIIFFISRRLYGDQGPWLYLFPEISHFSLIFLPLLLFKVLTFKKNIHAYMAILISLIISIDSLTLLCGTILIMLIYSIKKTFFLFLIPISLLIAIYGLEPEILELGRPGSPVNQLLDRLDFEDPNNFSTLVFLSGWERAYLNFFDYNFLGVGFNQLGFEGKIGFYQNKIAALGQPNLNLNDGGSLAPKLISELGILGIITVFIYLISLIKIVYQVKKYKLIYSYLDTFYISIFIMSFVFIFLRGSGYFSPSMFLLLSAIVYINKRNSNEYNIFLKLGISKL